MADSYHIIGGRAVPFSGGRKCNDTDAWRVRPDSKSKLIGRGGPTQKERIMTKFPDTYVFPAATVPTATKAEKSNADDKLAGINQLRRKSIETIAAALKKRGWDDGGGLTWTMEKTYSDVAAGGFHDIRQRSVTIGLSRNGQFIEASFGFDKIASEMVPEGGAESVFDKIAERLDSAAEAAIDGKAHFMGGARVRREMAAKQAQQPQADAMLKAQEGEQ